MRSLLRASSPSLATETTYPQFLTASVRSSLRSPSSSVIRTFMLSVPIIFKPAAPSIHRTGNKGRNKGRSPRPGFLLSVVTALYPVDRRKGGLKIAHDTPFLALFRYLDYISVRRAPLRISRLIP